LAALIRGSNSTGIRILYVMRAHIMRVTGGAWRLRFSLSRALSCLCHGSKATVARTHRRSRGTGRRAARASPPGFGPRL
jgi:hypothetical protein